jgi:hypothetical protein
MKFCYLDESGTGDEPFAVMAGVLVDAYRMRPTKEEWDELMVQLADIVGRDVKEFHTKDFYAGNSPWRNMDGPERASVLSAIFEWYAERGHQIVFSVIEKEKYLAIAEEHPFAKSLGTLWRTMAMHVALSLQKHHQRQKKNKGHTLLVFDSHEKDEKVFTEILLSPPEWTDTYYDRARSQKPMDQIIDVPHFVDSEHVGMIQLADCISYFIRRHVEIQEGAVPPKYAGEEEVVGRWVELALGRSIPAAAIYPKRGRCEAAEFFCQLSPSTITG